MKQGASSPLSYQLLSTYRAELMGAAMLWVMLFHADDLSLPHPALDLIRQFGYLGVDIFLFLSGLGLSMSLCRRRREPLHRYIKNRLLRIFPSYWLAVFPYSLWLLYQGRIPLSTLLWNCTGLHYWVQAPGGFNWYVSALLAFYLLAPCWFRLLQRSAHRERLTALLFPASYGLYLLSIPVHLLYTRDFVLRLPAFALGMLMGCYIHEGRTSLCKPLWGILTAVSGVLAWGVGTRRMYLAPCLIFSLAVFPLCLFLACLLRRMPWLQRPLAAIGTGSLEIYLLNVIATREIPCLWPHPFLFYLLLWTANLAAGILLHRGITKAVKFVEDTAEKRKSGREGIPLADPPHDRRLRQTSGTNAGAGRRSEHSSISQ